MSVQTIIGSLDKLVMLHESLLEISKQKTEIIKEGAVENLQTLLLKERKHVQVIEQAEVKRQQEVDKWFMEQNIPDTHATVTGILDVISDENERNELEKTTISLTEVITKLTNQEQLNKGLIQQSMQFIDLSLDMMNPSIKNLNYGNNKESDSVNRSVFDSKA